MHARIMVVGEQPGDREDLEGRPFVGPAGKLFDRALAELGWERGDLYVTNAVKRGDPAERETAWAAWLKDLRVALPRR